MQPTVTPTHDSTDLEHGLIPPPPALNDDAPIDPQRFSETLRESVDAIHPVLTEIRERVALIVQREIELSRRERELQRSPAPDEPGDGHTPHGAEMLRRESELQRREAELAVREELLRAARDHSETPAAPADEPQPRATDVAQRMARIAERNRELLRRVRSATSGADRRSEPDRREQELTQREAALREREQAVAEREQRLLPAPEQPSDANGAGSVELRALLAAERESLAAERARLDHEAADLAQRLAEHESIAEERSRYQAALAELADRESHAISRNHELQARIDALLARERDLVAERDTLHAQMSDDRARRAARVEELAARDAESDFLRAGAEQQLAELERAREQLARQRQELEAQAAHGAAERDSLERRAAALAEQAARLDERARSAERAAAELERTRVRIAAESAVLQQRCAALDEREAELNERSETQSQRDQLFEAQQRALDELAKRLAAREAELEALERELASQREADALQHTEINARRAEVDRLYEQAMAKQQRAKEHAREADALRRQLEQREAELRRQNLQTVLEREQLEEQRSRLISAVRDKESELERRVVAAPRPPVDPGTGRPLALATGLAAAAVFGLAFWLQPTQRYSRAEIAVQSGRAPTEYLVREHAAHLLGGGFLQHLSAPDDRRFWQAALDDGRLAVSPGEDYVQIAVRDDLRPEQVERRLRAGIAGYQSWLETLPATSWLKPADRVWSERRDALVSELDAVRYELDEYSQQLRETPEFDEWSLIQAQLERDRIDLSRAVLDLAAARDTLAARNAIEIGTVAPAESAVDQALAADPIFTEDTKEIDAESRKYRMELALALVTLIEPIKTLRGASRDVGEALREQQELNPPDAIRSVLESLRAELDEYDARLAEFASAWDARRARVEHPSGGEPAIELVASQQAAVDEARAIATASGAFVEKATAALQRFGAENDASTRAVVVAAVLRGSLNAVTQAAGALSAQTANVDPTTNFKLDAADRQIRGLLSRLQGRRAIVLEQLQRTAHDAAVNERTRLINDARTLVADLEVRRDALTDAVVTAVARLRELENENEYARDLHAAHAAASAAGSRLENRICDLEANAPDSTPDQLALLGIRSTPTNQDARFRVAAAAGLAAGLAVWLAGRNVAQRVRRPAPALA